MIGIEEKYEAALTEAKRQMALAKLYRGEIVEAQYQRMAKVWKAIAGDYEEKISTCGG